MEYHECYKCENIAISKRKIKNSVYYMCGEHLGEKDSFDFRNDIESILNNWNMLEDVDNYEMQYCLAEISDYITQTLIECDGPFEIKKQKTKKKR